MSFLPLNYSLRLAVCVIVFACSGVFAQSQQELLPLDESQFTDSAAAKKDSTPPVAPVHSNTAPAASEIAKPADKPPVEPGPASEPDDGLSETGTQNAVIEGVQLSSEPGEKPEEKVISCYFIFRDKPSSYFYEVKTKEKKIVFEFNDTKTGSSPIPSTAEAPIKGFTTELRKIDINKEVKGLKPEYHSQVRVTFDLDKVPEIHVVDEYNVISFSYKWSDNPTKVPNYVLKESSNMKYVYISSACVAGIGGVAFAYWYTHRTPPPPELGPIDPSDLPKHP
jgi:hypothetical protein